MHFWVQIGQIHTWLFSLSTEFSKQTSCCLWFHSFVLDSSISWVKFLVLEFHLLTLHRKKVIMQCWTLWSSSPEIPTISSSRISSWFVEDLTDLTFTWVFIITCYCFHHSRYSTASQLSTFNIHWYTRIFLCFTCISSLDQLWNNALPPIHYWTAI
jgi:hypothetical protein